MNNKDEQQREIGTAPLGPLLLKFCLPAIIAMTATSLYNLADSIFIGQGVGSLGLAGLTVCFPLMNLSAAFGAMVGIGAGSVIAIKLGQRELEVAEHTLGNVVLLNVIIGTLFAVVALLFLDPILRFFGASDAILPYGREYMTTLLYGNVLTHLYFGLNDTVRSSGYPRRAMMATLSAVCINVLFDYILIVRLGFGIRGAAVATLLAQSVGFIVVISHLSRSSSVIHFRRDIFRWRTKIARGIISIGCAPFFTNVCACLVVLLINRGLVDYGGDSYIAAYGIVNRVAFIFVMITNGINQGMQPISGYNYGAGNVERCVGVFKYAAVAGTVVMSVCFIVAEVFPRQTILWFTSDELLIDIAEHAMRISLLMAAFGGFHIVSIGFMMSLGQAMKATFLSLSRQLLFLVPLLLCLPPFFGADGVWFSMPIADAAADVAAVILVISQIRKLRDRKNVQLP